MQQLASRPWLAATAVALAQLLAAGVADAAGTQLPAHGVRGLSMGGAIVAGATGLDAFWHNPALLDETSVTLSVGFVDLSARFQRAGHEAVENAATPLPQPALGGVWRIDDRFSLGFGVYAPMGAQYAFPEDGPQRYSLVENSRSAVLFFHLAGAVRVGRLSLGAGLQNVYAHVIQRSVLSGYSGLFGWEEDPELDVVSELELRDPFTLTGNFGASYALEDFTFGASLQLPYTIAGEATFLNRLPSSVFFDPSSLDGSTATLEVPHPLTARAGIQWRPSDRAFVEIAFQWEQWSTQQTLRLVPQDITLQGVPAIGDYVQRPIELERRMKDTVSFHLGANAEIVRDLHLRGGVFYETSGFDDETFSVAVMDADKIGVGGGLSWYWWKLRFDVAVGRIFGLTREVTNSTQRQVNPTDPSLATVVGNGTYESGFWAGGAGIAWLYD